MAFISFYFNLWRTNVNKRKLEYEEWCEYREESIAEENFACESGMDSVNWCWNCKHSDCDIH
jgi:hypothetical protein